MITKCIILKTQSKEFNNILLYKLNEFKSIRYFTFKINGFYTTVIKCFDYYSSRSLTYKFKNKLYKMNILGSSTLEKYNEVALYGSYIFLYSIVSIILSELFILYFEHSITKRIIASQKEMKVNLEKLSSISSLLLDEHSPFEFSETLYKRRKNCILNETLKNFRKCNYIFIDYFLDFFAKDYIYELEKIINASIEILNNKPLYNYMMNFIFQNNP